MTILCQNNKEFKYTLVLSPDHAGAFCSLGNAYYDKGMLDDAIAAWKKAIRIDPSWKCIR